MGEMQAKNPSRLRYDGQPENVLYRIQRGLTGYVSYLAACEMNVVFTEYVLYEPLLRIMATAGYKVNSEVIAPNVKQPKTGDKKKVDFVGVLETARIVIEVKWTDFSKVIVDGEMEKLIGFKNEADKPRCFLCIFGQHNAIGITKDSKRDRLKLEYDPRKLEKFKLKELLEPRFAYLVATQYGCRVFEIA